MQEVGLQCEDRRGWKIERYKARLVAWGNEKLFWVDYGLTFAAVIVPKMWYWILHGDGVCWRGKGHPERLRKGRQGRSFGYLPVHTARYGNPHRRYAEVTDTRSQVALRLNKSL